ncbi:MAG: peptidoglycan DD-metalloendopeptidase family protein [Bacteroidetes bacterium]|nr:peptidoglycan DD-metalloendopeptidase family protein [Bacteroidota bacterium]
MKKKKTTLTVFAVHILGLIFLVIPQCSQNENGGNTESAVPQNISQNKTEGIPDSLDEHQSKINKGETLSDILLSFDVPFTTISKIVRAFNQVDDVRKIQPGKNYSAFFENDSVYKLKYFLYEKDPVNYILVSMDDTIKVTIGEKKVETKERRVSGVINSSLYTTLKDLAVSDKLALSLSEVFAWQIDFYRIQKGDTFKVIFEEEFIDGKFIGIGKITSADFVHWGEKYYAFYFEQDGDGEYFDEEGKSLRKAFLKTPVKFSRISSGYSNRRFHPVLKTYKAHLGTDFAAPTGTPIFSVGDGVVIEAGYKGNNGNHVKIRHNGTYTTQYLHMSKIKTGIRSGVKIKQGQVIGFVGQTGLATGPHVCFRFWKNRNQVNHRKEKFPASHPVKSANMENYLNTMNHLRNLLSFISIEKTEIAKL